MVQGSASDSWGQEAAPEPAGPGTKITPGVEEGAQSEARVRGVPNEAANPPLTLPVLDSLD